MTLAENHVLEANFPFDYRQDVVSQMFAHLKNTESFSFIGVRDNCKINVLRFISSRSEIQKHYLGESAKKYLWVMVDLNELMDTSLTSFYHLLGASLIESLPDTKHKHYLNNLYMDSPAVLFKALKQDLANLVTQTGRTVIFLFNNIDVLDEKITTVYRQLVALRNAARYKITYVFSGTRPIMINHFFFKKIVWMTPFKGTDALGVITRNCTRYHVDPAKINTEDILIKSGGHGGLIKFIIQDLSRGTNTGGYSDVYFQCERILQSLSELEKSKLKSCREDSLLQNLGLQVKHGKKYSVFSSLMNDYLAGNHISIHPFCLDEENDEIYAWGKPLKRTFTGKEFGLMKLLVKKSGTIVTRQEIMNTVWTPEGFPSDWALDKLVSRVKHKLHTRGKTGLEVIRGNGICLQNS